MGGRLFRESECWNSAFPCVLPFQRQCTSWAAEKLSRLPGRKQEGGFKAGSDKKGAVRTSSKTELFVSCLQRPRNRLMGDKQNKQTKNNIKASKQEKTVWIFFSGSAFSL